MDTSRRCRPLCSLNAESRDGDQFSSEQCYDSAVPVVRSRRLARPGAGCPPDRVGMDQGDKTRLSGPVVSTENPTSQTHSQPPPHRPHLRSDNFVISQPWFGVAMPGGGEVRAASLAPKLFTLAVSPRAARRAPARVRENMGRDEPRPCEQECSRHCQASEPRLTKQH